MATVRSIIASALRKSGQLAMGEDPEINELNIGSDLLLSLYSGWLTSGLLGRLTDIIASTDATAGEYQRIAAAAGVTITLPDTITDPCCAAPRPPRNRALVVIAFANGNTQASLFDAATGTWARLDQLASNDVEAPLSGANADGLASCLAERWAGEMGQQVVPVVIQTAAAFRLALACRFDSVREPVAAEYF